MPKLVSISVDRPGVSYIAIDEAGHVWRGALRRSRAAADYLDWTPLDSEFPREPGR
jgi:hypothetical protein